MPMTYYLILSATMFVIGALGVVLRRNPLVVFMSLELLPTCCLWLFLPTTACWTATCSSFL